MTDITKYNGERCILDQIELHIEDKDKIGILGVNGTGKSTLLKIISGIEDYQGKMTYQKDLRINYLPQTPLYNEMDTIMETVYKQIDSKDIHDFEIKAQLGKFGIYDENQKIKELSPTLSASYTQKEDAGTIYYNASEFAAQPLIMIKHEDGTPPKITKEKVPAKKMNELTVQEELRSYELPEQQEKEIKVVSQSEFDQLSLPQSTLQLVQVKDFQANLKPIETLAKASLGESI